MGLQERRQREREQRKNSILDAARKLLFENGINGTSINKIAKTAEIGVGTIYFYFENKEEIFVELQMEGIHILNSMLEEAFDSSSDCEVKLKKIAEAYLQFSREQKDYFDMINYFLSSPEIVFAPSLKDQVDKYGKQGVGYLVRAIQDGVDKGQFKKMDSPKPHAIMFWAILHGLVQFRKLKNTILEGEEIDTILEFALNDFIGNLRKV